MIWTIVVPGVCFLVLFLASLRISFKMGYSKGTQAPVFRPVIEVPDTESRPHPTIRSADIRRAHQGDVTRISGPNNLREKD